MDCSLPGYSVHGILQARVLEWVVISFSRGSSQPRDRTALAGGFFTTRATWEAPEEGNKPEIFYCCSLLSSLQDGGAAGTAQGAPVSSMLGTPLAQLATFPRPAQGPPRSTSPPQQADHLHSQGLPITLTHGVWGTPSPRLPWSYFRRIYSKQEDCLTKTWPSLSCFD